MMRRAEFIRCLLSVVSDRAQTAYQDVLGEWQPEDPPVTELFAALGYQIADFVVLRRMPIFERFH